MVIAFGTKAETLERLRPVLNGATVLPSIKFSVGEWRSDPQAGLERIRAEYPQGKLIVRSSANSEDTLQGSNAGKFDSVSNVDASDTAAVQKAVEQVMRSFGDDAADSNQFFIQTFLTDIAVSGVIFTRDMDMLSPYFIVNYDEKSKSTDSVTSGRSNQLKTLIKFRNQPTRFKKFEKLFQVIAQIEAVFESDCLDIEFAIDSKGAIFILQVRPLVRQNRTLPRTSQVGHYLHKIFMKAEHLNQRHPYLYGNRTLLGVMPDWNPAEMIGVKPHPLALSLYEELITDKTWSVARAQYGYKDVRSYPLMVALIHQPYIDVRVSFNSFIPAALNEDLAERLAAYYLGRLEALPASHDKVEFDIILSCYFFNIREKLIQLEKEGFSKKDTEQLESSLLYLTNQVIGGTVFQDDLDAIETLKTRQQKVLGSSLIPLEKIYWLIEDCKRYGTRPFAGIARAAFIAVQILKSLPSTGAITEKEVELFMSSIHTVSKQMAKDHAQLSRSEFLEIYGHLRPGTYDILSASYAEGYDLYFDKTEAVVPASEKPFEFSSGALKAMDRALEQAGLATDAAGLISFIRRAIEGREYAKFVFTKSVSEILGHIKELTRFYGLSIEDASFINVKTLHQLYATLDHRDLCIILAEEIERNKEFHEITKLLKLPALIVKPEEVFEFELEEGVPNFITLGRCQSETVIEEDLLFKSLTGKIVFIPSADPGYDWIFTKKIAGLVTMYGGANSHMAIRAAELRIPAVIGAGEKNYQNWLDAKILEIDSLNKQVRVIR